MAFSRRDLFWYCAGVSTVLVIGLLLRSLNGSQNNAPVSADSASAAPQSMPAQSSAPPSGGSQAAGSMEEVLAKLEARLATQGGNDSDWELLAQTYEFVGRTADAKLARAHQLPVSASAPQPSAAGAVSGQVELASSLKSSIPNGLTLFIVAKSVDSPGPPLAVMRTTTGHWPLSFTLDDSNSMVPGRTLSSAQHVTVEARVSKSGMAGPQPGDFQSTVTTIDPQHANSVRIVIDHIIS